MDNLEKFQERIEAARAAKVGLDPSVRDALAEFDANREAIDAAFEGMMAKAAVLGTPHAFRLRHAFYSGVGFSILQYQRREEEKADISQQIVDALRAAAKGVGSGGTS